MRREIRKMVGASAVMLTAGWFALQFCPSSSDGRDQPPPETAANADYSKSIRPIIAKYCLECHSTKVKKGSLDLERFTTLDSIRKDVKPWQEIVEQVTAGEMPPKGKPQPTDDEKRRLLDWIRRFLDDEARARSGDPGQVRLRRLSNAEYDATVRDLTGVDLRPTREFPSDGAGGEGFTNAAESLSDVSPALMTKYLSAAKEISDHAVLLPNGFRFSRSKTRRDWTDEGTTNLRQFYAAYSTGDGTLNFQPYLLATVRHRAELSRGMFRETAAVEKLNEKYLSVLWDVLTAKSASEPLATIRRKWQLATEKEVPAIGADVAAWQAQLWKTVRIGNYVRESWGSPPGNGYTESLSRQVPVDPTPLETITLRFTTKPAPGTADVVVQLEAAESGLGRPIVWSRPRIQTPNQPAMMLHNYAAFGPSFEIDFALAFADAAKYLAAAASLASDGKLMLDKVAEEQSLNAIYLKKWVDVLALPKGSGPPTTTAIPVSLLDEKTPPNVQWPAISGWRKKGAELPSVVSNNSDVALQIPGHITAHGIAVHPMPNEFVAVVWKSPIKGQVAVAAEIVHAHPACGNGVAWWAEHRRSGRALRLGEGVIDLGKQQKLPHVPVSVEVGDEVILAVDARDSNHVCDLTRIALRISDPENPKRTWDLADDVAATIQAGNPHSDKLGNSGTWSFVRGASTKSAKSAALISPASVLGRWRASVAIPASAAESHRLALQVQDLFKGPRPDPNHPDRALYDRFVTADGPLFTGVDLQKISVSPKSPRAYALDQKHYDTQGDIEGQSNQVLQIRLPAALLVGREFVVDARLPKNNGDRVVRVRAGDATSSWNPAVLGKADSAGHRQLVQGNSEFRSVFPLFVCFPAVVPTDEVVTLKMFHREDEPLQRLFLPTEQLRRLDQLWAEQRFVSRQPAAEFDYLPQFMGYTTQDTPKEFQQFFIDRKPLFRKHAEEFEAEEKAAIPAHLKALTQFAEKAYRRPIQEKERADLINLYHDVRRKGAAHDEAFRGVLARVLLAPSFLFRIEQPPQGKEPVPVSSSELATRLSYFLWSSMPDEELQSLARQSKLHDPAVLESQARRMLRDDRTRSLAIEFGTQWLHVRGFDEFKEKNEKLFPTLNAELRRDMYEEAIRFFLDLFQNDRPILSVLSANHTFLNQTLAAHYGIPGVSGKEWRRVDGVNKYGRGGVLGFASVLSKQAGASRTSPILRGNWVVETLLGEKLPRPPANVPQLPEVEGADRLTMRQLVERHSKDPACASCHVRVDPFGFALEQFDAIGRIRKTDLGGLEINVKSRLRDGAEFEGIDGLRGYLLSTKKDVIVRLFCRRLLGFALGRSVALSDSKLLDDMVNEVNRNDGRVWAALRTILHSPQFRMIRGADAAMSD
jgi:hypothetical protein